MLCSGNEIRLRGGSGVDHGVMHIEGEVFHRDDKRVWRVQRRWIRVVGTLKHIRDGSPRLPL